MVRSNSKPLCRPAHPAPPVWPRGDRTTACRPCKPYTRQRIPRHRTRKTCLTLHHPARTVDRIVSIGRPPRQPTHFPPDKINARPAMKRTLRLRLRHHNSSSSSSNRIMHNLCKHSPRRQRRSRSNSTRLRSALRRITATSQYLLFKLRRRRLSLNRITLLPSSHHISPRATDRPRKRWRHNM